MSNKAWGRSPVGSHRARLAKWLAVLAAALALLGATTAAGS